MSGLQGQVRMEGICTEGMVCAEADGERGGASRREAKV